MLPKAPAIGLVVAVVVLMAACGSAAPTPTPTVAAKATLAPSAATAASPVAKSAAKPSALDELIGGARKEGVVTAWLLDSLGQRGSQRLIDAFNKKYNLNIRLDYTPTSSFSRAMVQVITELKTGGSPTADVINGNMRNLYDLADSKLLVAYDWPGTFSYIPRETMRMDGTFFTYATGYYLPAYNPNLVKPEDVPKKWEDLLSPKWSGKAVAHNSSGPWVALAEEWGDERVTTLLEGLAKHKPAYLTISQIAPRVGSGEYSIALTGHAGMTLQAQGQGAPIRSAEEVKPLLGQIYGLAIPQRAQHPNAAKLFIAFHLTPEAQQIWWEETKWASPFVPGAMADWMKGKAASYVSNEFLVKEEKRLDEKYRNILGIK